MKTRKKNVLEFRTDRKGEIRITYWLTSTAVLGVRRGWCLPACYLQSAEISCWPAARRAVQRSTQQSRHAGAQAGAAAARRAAVLCCICRRMDKDIDHATPLLLTITTARDVSFSNHRIHGEQCNGLAGRPNSVVTVQYSRHSQRYSILTGSHFQQPSETVNARTWMPFLTKG